MQPKIIAVANTKGGVGKTTVALQLAAYCAQRGEDVWLVDGDRQQTAMNAISLRETQPGLPTIGCAGYSDGMVLRTQVLHQLDKWSRIIIDVGGMDSTAMRAALVLCDVLLVPFQPRSFDVWALSKMSTIVREANEIRSTPIKAYAFLNSADPKSLENTEAAEALQDFPELEFIDAPLRRRKVFATSSGFGIGVGEVKDRKDRKAIAELEALAAVVFEKKEEENHGLS